MWAATAGGVGLTDSRNVEGWCVPLPTDIFPYSQRLGGQVTDLEHEDLWSPIADGILPGQVPTAMDVSVSAPNWFVEAGKIHIAGHVIHFDTQQSGPLPPAGAATRTSYIVAYIDHSQNPWEYGIDVVIGTPGGGAPQLSKSQSGRYEVALRTLLTFSNGSQSLVAGDEPRLQPVGLAQAYPWTTINSLLTSTRAVYDKDVQIRRLPHDVVAMRGSIKRSNDEPMDASGAGFSLIRIPQEYRPGGKRRSAVATGLAGAGSAKVGFVVLDNDGWVTLKSNEGPQWSSVDFSYSIT